MHPNIGGREIHYEKVRVKKGSEKPKTCISTESVI